jgi:hypothetical protein
MANFGLKHLSFQVHLEKKVTAPASVTVEMSAPRYLTFRLKNTEKTTKQIKPSYVKKAVDVIARKVEKD